MTIKSTSPEKTLIVICGLPGSGKTTLTKKLLAGLKDYVVIDQNEIRRKHGMKRMPKRQGHINNEINYMIAMCLSDNKGVIFDSINKMMHRRHQLYGIASSCKKRVVVIETVCSECVAKDRMRARPNSDGLLSDPNDTKVYDRSKDFWEDVHLDYVNADISFVAYLQFNSEKNEVKKIIAQRSMSRIIKLIRTILTT